MTTVFVTDGQIRSALATVRSLGSADIDVVCGESTRFATSFASKYVDETVVYPDPEENASAFVSYLESYLKENDIDVLVPIAHESTRLINNNIKNLSQHTKVPVAGPNKFNRAVKKDNILSLANELNIPHPRTISPSSIDSALKFASSLGYPLVLKPTDSSGSRGLHYISSDKDLRSKYAKVTAEYSDVLLQEKIPEKGKGMGAGFLFWEGEVVAEFAYRRLREYPPDGGPSTVRESIHHDQLLEYGRTLLEKIEWHGVAMVEFKNDPQTDTPYLMEINPRFWGSLHLPMRSGIHFPRLLVQKALGEKVNKPKYKSGVRCRFLLPGDLLYLLSEHNTKALDEFFPIRGVKYDIFDPDDPLPVLGRVAAMMRYSLNLKMWKKVVFRSR